MTRDVNSFAFEVLGFKNFEFKAFLGVMCLDAKKGGKGVPNVRVSLEILNSEVKF